MFPSYILKNVKKRMLNSLDFGNENDDMNDLMVYMKERS